MSTTDRIIVNVVRIYKTKLTLNAVDLTYCIVNKCDPLLWYSVTSCASQQVLQIPARFYGVSLRKHFSSSLNCFLDLMILYNQMVVILACHAATLSKSCSQQCKARHKPRDSEIQSALVLETIHSAAFSILEMIIF